MGLRDSEAIQAVDRLREITELQLLSDEVDEELQRAVEQAAAHFDLPIGLVSVILDQAQRFAASRGLSGWIAEAGGTPVEWSFCANSVETRQPFVVEDAEQDARVRDNPMVTLEGIRCYAGIPLVSSRGFVLGNLCVVGTEPRSFADAELDYLREIADAVVRRIETRRREP